ncbi:MAG: dihydrodipicolinate synthase family protein [Clostridia bacterium]|nr:dihydrodipicolinate synthase family protein [Clostridia bacterium]
MNALKKGVYVALGTPLDGNGDVIEQSLRTEIRQQIEAGASGLLLMGSMGIQASIKASACRRAVEIAVDEVKNSVPLFVGAMDNSVARVKDRIDAMRDLDYTAVVLTTPYYSTSRDANIVAFFKAIADYADKPVFLYDLPVVTKQKITLPMVLELAQHNNIKGIKSGDLVLARKLRQLAPEFEVLFSNIDVFDVAISYGIDKVLDGMFSATPKNEADFVKAIEAGDIAACTKSLDKILYLRDFYLKYDLMAAFTASMNLLGCEGQFSQDYINEIEVTREGVLGAMKEIGEI